jgi:hypothetical protein
MSSQEYDAAMQTRIAAAVVLAALMGCTAEERQAVAELQAVQASIAKLYPDGTVNLTLVNGRHLVISVVNSSFNKRPEGEREAQARRSAQAGFAGCKGELDQVSVRFTSRTGVGITVRRTIANYLFTADELRAAAPAR